MKTKHRCVISSKHPVLKLVAPMSLIYDSKQMCNLMCRAEHRQTMAHLLSLLSSAFCRTIITLAEGYLVPHAESGAYTIGRATHSKHSKLVLLSISTLGAQQFVPDLQAAGCCPVLQLGAALP